MNTGVVVKWIRKTVSSFFFIGYLPAPGTVASAVTVAILWFAGRKGVFSPEEPAVYWLVTLAVVACSLFFSDRSRALFGREDSGRIVIDEVAGQLVTFCMVPLSARTLIAGFFLFQGYFLKAI